MGLCGNGSNLLGSESAANRHTPKPGGDLNAPDAPRAKEGAPAIGVRAPLRRFGYPLNPQTSKPAPSANPNPVALTRSAERRGWVLRWFSAGRKTAIQDCQNSNPKGICRGDGEWPRKSAKTKGRKAIRRVYSALSGCTVFRPFLSQSAALGLITAAPLALKETRTGRCFVFPNRAIPNRAI